MSDSRNVPGFEEIHVDDLTQNFSWKAFEQRNAFFIFLTGTLHTKCRNISRKSGSDEWINANASRMVSADGRAVRLWPYVSFRIIGVVDIMFYVAEGK
jgi:hypothetical protein